MAGFDDLEDAVEDQSGDDANESPEESVDTEPNPTAEVGESTGRDVPGFQYDEVKQGPIYPRAETWEAFEDEMVMTITPNLHSEGVRNVEKREIHDALLRLAVENPEELAELVISEREGGD
jgi:hypothetical protein